MSCQHPITNKLCNWGSLGSCIRESCPDCKGSGRCRLCGGFVERCSYVAWLKANEGYDPPHNDKNPFYCDACNLPSCMANPFPDDKQSEPMIGYR